MILSITNGGFFRPATKVFELFIQLFNLFILFIFRCQLLPATGVAWVGNAVEWYIHRSFRTSLTIEWNYSEKAAEF